MPNETAAFQGLYDIVKRLRGPGGCPWDREQTPKTLRGDLIEETYECLEAIDRGEADHIQEELGDLFLLVTMLSYMHEQEDRFSVADVLRGVSEKLVRRHPHVFGEPQPPEEAGSGGAARPLTSAEVLENWARIKVEQEGRKPKDSLLDEVSSALPPLDRAYKLQKKAAKAGFDWPNLQGVMDKIHEELREVSEALEAQSAASGEAGGPPVSGPDPAAKLEPDSAVEEELGDLLFSVINLCRYLKVEPSVALQGTNAKFVRRFKYVEGEMKSQGLPMNLENLALMDRYWEAAKDL